MNLRCPGCSAARRSGRGAAPAAWALPGWRRPGGAGQSLGAAGGRWPLEPLHQQAQVCRGGAAAAAHHIDVVFVRQIRPACRQRVRVPADKRPVHPHSAASRRWGCRRRAGWNARPGSGWVRACNPARWSSSGRSRRCCMPSRMASTAAISVPSSMRPVVSSVTWAWMGRQMPVSVKACWMPTMAALTSRISWDVSISNQVDPAFDQAGGLFAENIRQFVKGDVGQFRIIHGRQFAGRADRAGHKARLIRRGVFIRQPAGQAQRQPG